MSMHLVKGVYAATSKKKKQQVTKSKLEQYTRDLAARNKQLKQQGRHSEIMTIDQYVAYVTGTAKSPKKSSKSVVETKQLYRPAEQSIPSLDTGVGIAGRSEPKQYTGTLVKGLMTMHKSNLVPVINEDEIRAITTMRRN